MNLIIDTNIFISALIKNSLTRHLIVHSLFDLFIPEQEMIEIKKYEELILKKSFQTKDELRTLIRDLLRYIKVIQNSNLLPFRERARKIMEKIDKKDVPFIAASLVLNCPIWSDDKHFQKQKEIQIFTTKEVFEIFNNGNSSQK